MTEPVTKKIYCRVSHTGSLVAVTDDDDDNGYTLQEAWDNTDGTEPFRDFTIQVTVRPPDTSPPIDAVVDVPDETRPEVTATAA